MLRQIGIFVFMVGVFLVVLFFAADTKDSLALKFLCWGLPLIILSFLIWKRTRGRLDSSRFRTMRKIMRRSKKDEE